MIEFAMVADDHTIVRAYVRLLLEGEPDIEVVGEALDGREARAVAGEPIDTYPGIKRQQSWRFLLHNWQFLRYQNV